MYCCVNFLYSSILIYPHWSERLARTQDKVCIPHTSFYAIKTLPPPPISYQTSMDSHIRHYTFALSNLKTEKMTTSIKATDAQKYARTAGLLYLLIAIAGGYSIGYVPSQILVAGDAQATVNNIMTKQGLYFTGILGDTIVIIFEVILTAMLYHMFKNVNSTVSLLAAYARIGMTIVMAINLFNYLLPLAIIDGSGYLSTFSQEQLNAACLFLLDAHQYGVYIWQVFFAIHMVGLGYLIIKSGYYPKLLGFLILIGSIGYIGDSIINVTGADSLTIIVNILLTVAVVGELGFTFWLLFKGVNKEKLAQAKQLSTSTGF